jgi:hypothetical protein
MYDNAPRMEQVMIHLFGIKYSDEIKKMLVKP